VLEKKQKEIDEYEHFLVQELKKLDKNFMMSMETRCFLC
jgi:hypothetical protein